MALIADSVFDLALAELTNNTSTLYITSAEATTFANASSLALGSKATPTVGAAEP